MRASVVTLLNGRTDILEADKHKLTELSRQLRRIGTNLNQLAHAHRAGLLVQPVNAGDLLSELRAALVNAPYEERRRAHLQSRLQGLENHLRR